MRTANLIRYKLLKESSRRYVDDLSFRDVVDSRGHVWEFGDYAFQRCNSFTSIILPNSFRSLGRNAFHGCSSLRSIEISSLVESIGIDAFVGCSSLTSVTVKSNSIESYERVKLMLIGAQVRETIIFMKEVN